MLHLDSVWGVVVVVAIAMLLAIAILLAPRLLAPRARLRRRLKKTHSRIVSKSQRPTVKFSVRTPKDKK